MDVLKPSKIEIETPHKMYVSHWLEGLVIAPIFAAVIFLLKLTCPADTGEGCFVDPFYGILFLPLPFIYKIFSSNLVLVGRHEILFILGYWAIVGFLLGLLVHVHKKETH
ncbi:MAG: hypothetical protein M3Q24_02430 [bacterium]|nr:hypothetical protein [bacterium]